MRMVASRCGVGPDGALSKMLQLSCACEQFNVKKTKARDVAAAISHANE